jgi:hypothetical protein
MSSLLVFNRVYGHVGIFDPSCELLLLYFLSDLPHPPSQSKRTVYTDSVWLWGVGWGGGGVELCCRPYSAEV